MPGDTSGDNVNVGICSPPDNRRFFDHGIANGVPGESGNPDHPSHGGAGDLHHPLRERPGDREGDTHTVSEAIATEHGVVGECLSDFTHEGLSELGKSRVVLGREVAGVQIRCHGPCSGRCGGPRVHLSLECCDNLDRVNSRGESFGKSAPDETLHRALKTVEKTHGTPPRHRGCCA